MRNKTVVALVQISRETVTESAPQYHMRNGRVACNLWASGSLGGTSAYLPYSTGLLQAYAQKYAAAPERFEFLLPIHKPVRPSEAMERLERADVVAFSAYIWNIRQSLRIARELKRLRPDVLTVFGGPQVPNSAEAFLREHRSVDIACHGEGERVFLQILERAWTREWDGIPSISYLNTREEFVSHPRAARMQDLSAIPSPFLEGVFDPLMRANPEVRWHAAWETNRGCPFGCTFCDWGGAIASKVYRFDMERVKAETDWFARKRLAHVFFCDANFGILARDIEIAKAFVESLERHKARMSVSVQTAKNSTERCYEAQRILWNSGRAFLSATTSLQSVDAGALKAIKRDNISLESFHELQRRHRANGLPTNTEMIVGLPGETYESFANGVAEVISRGQHNYLNVYECQVLPNAEMGSPEYQRRYGMELKAVPMLEGPLTCDGEERVTECIDTVIATQSMPREHWVRARAFAWATQFLHFDRVLQVPFVLLANEYGAGYREMIEAFLNCDGGPYPVCADMAAIFWNAARRLQQGYPGAVASRECLNQWWTPDAYALISLADSEKWEAFFEEAEQILRPFGREHARFDHRLLADCVVLNRELFKRAGVFTDTSITVCANLLEYFAGVVEGRPVTLERIQTTYHIDRTSAVWPSADDWYRFIDQTQGDPGQYLYTALAVPAAMAAAM